MFPKGKGTPVPSDSQAREKLALYVYEYLLHIGAQKSAQTFLSEIRWEKNITLVSSLCNVIKCPLVCDVFWDLYCAAPERRETCDHSSEAKAFHDYSAAAAPSPVMGGMPPGDGMPGGPMPPAFFQSFMSPRFAGGPRGPPIRMASQPPGGGPGPHPMLPNMDPTRPQGRMSGPRGMGPMGPGPQNFGGGMRPPHNTMGPGMPGVNMGPGTGRPWPNPNNANSLLNLSLFLCYPRLYVYTFSPSDSNNSGDNLYTMINTGPGNRNNFPMGPGSDGPLGAMAGMEPHHMNGSLGNTTHHSNSPNNLSGISNPPGTPRDDGELSGNFLHSFQSENVSRQSVCSCSSAVMKPETQART
uniref:Single stranded DNA binding protein 3b n=1 Tax=Haplochromis burtoni TaxID=8153 RepID=A0A3Q3CLN3_HAPBU